MPKKEVKGDSQNVKHIKLKLHNFHDVSFYNSIYILFIYSRYAFMLLCWRQTEKEKEGALLAELITGWQFNKFLRSFVQKKKNSLIFCVYIHFPHEFRC